MAIQLGNLAEVIRIQDLWILFSMRFISTLENWNQLKWDRYIEKKYHWNLYLLVRYFLHQYLTVKNHISEALWLGTWYHLTVKVYILNLVLNPIGILTSSLETNFGLKKWIWDLWLFESLWAWLWRVQSSPVLRPRSASINSRVRKRSHSCSYHYVSATEMISFTFRSSKNYLCFRD